jgi:hypothetical protein
METAKPMHDLNFSHGHARMKHRWRQSMALIFTTQNTIRVRSVLLTFRIFARRADFYRRAQRKQSLAKRGICSPTLCALCSLLLNLFNLGLPGRSPRWVSSVAKKSAACSSSPLGALGVMAVQKVFSVIPNLPISTPLYRAIRGGARFGVWATNWTLMDFMISAICCYSKIDQRLRQNTFGLKSSWKIRSEISK